MSKAKKETRIARELERLETIIAKADRIQKEATSKLLQNIAFMAITLEDLQEEINAHGTEEVYQHGASQSGIKQSAAVQNYNSIVKNYITAVKTLLSILPEQAQKEAGANSLLELLERSKNK